MPYRETGDAMGERETWAEKTRAVVRVAKWTCTGMLCVAAMLGGFAAAVRECNRPDPCRDTVTLLSPSVAGQSACTAGARMEVTPTAAGHIARCVCAGSR